MKITTETPIWIVADPTPVSAIEDVLHPCTLPQLENIMIGTAMRCGKQRMSDANLTIYTNEAEARKDAEARMAARD